MPPARRKGRTSGVAKTKATPNTEATPRAEATTEVEATPEAEAAPEEIDITVCLCLVIFRHFLVLICK